jgi:tRNA(Arg) A34 adenosine deaminase TadA
MNNTPVNETDLQFLRRAIAVSRAALEHGNHPFGAILVSGSGEMLLEAENTVTTSRDATGHAETNLMRLASGRFSSELLATSTMYSSCEPCVMCSGAVYWTGVGRIVYGMSETKLYELTGSNPHNPTMHLGCREVLDRGQRRFEVHGPHLEDEAAAVHTGFWDSLNG